MRLKARVYIGTSLDGFIAREDGDIDWLTQFANDEAIHAYEEFISRIDAVVLVEVLLKKYSLFLPGLMIEKYLF